MKIQAAALPSRRRTSRLLGDLKTGEGDREKQKAGEEADRGRGEERERVEEYVQGASGHRSQYTAHGVHGIVHTNRQALAYLRSPGDQRDVGRTDQSVSGGEERQRRRGDDHAVRQ